MDEAESILVYHYTDRAGYNAIHSQVDWVFKAHEQRRKGLRDVRPFGAYFSLLPPDAPEISVRLMVPKEKQEFVFIFRSTEDLQPLRGGRGKHVLFSPEDYNVERGRQVWCGPTAEYEGELK